MYYRNANCAVVVYDITQAVGCPLLCYIDGMLTLIFETVIVGQGQIVGEGITAPGK